ncbi:MAG: hypothetical protein WBN06_12765, partial [Lysobacterales bacterium]
INYKKARIAGFFLPIDCPDILETTAVDPTLGSSIQFSGNYYDRNYQIQTDQKTKGQGRQDGKT